MTEAKQLTFEQILETPAPSDHPVRVVEVSEPKGARLYPKKTKPDAWAILRRKFGMTRQDVEEDITKRCKR